MSMTYMIWMASAGVLGIGLGVLGYYYSKTAYAIFLMGLSGIAIITNIYMGASAGVVGMTSENKFGVFYGMLRKISTAIDLLGKLPMHMQTAIVTFTVTFFLARIGAWWYQTKRPKEEETLEARKQRVLKSYGMTSMDDVRKLR